MKHPFDETLIDTATGRRPADLVLLGGRLVNVCTGEIHETGIAVVNGQVATLGDVEHLIGDATVVHQLNGRYVMPGFLDGHQHLEDSRMSVSGFSDAVVPVGTTSIVSGLDHIAAVAGPRGVRTFLDEAAGVDLSVFWAAPFRLPYTDPPSTVGRRWTEAEHRETQEWAECIGVWELSPDFVTVKDPDTLAAVRLARERGLGVYGSVPWAADGMDVVAAHAGAGLRVDHEAYTQDELLAKMRLGLHVLIRDSPAEHFLPPLVGLFVDRPELAHRVGFCTDQASVRDVRANGHISRLVREAVAAGVPPVTAVQMATINTAAIYRIDHIVGSITPGCRADLLVAEDMERFDFTHVYVAGRLVARDGRMLKPTTPPPRPAFLIAPFPREGVDAAELSITATAPRVDALVMELTDNAFHRRSRVASLSTHHGIVLPDATQDVALLAYVERFGKTDGPPGTAFVSGFGLRQGALATSCSPDDENILCVGTDAADMACAINTLIACGGGDVVVSGGSVRALLELPVGGIVCDLSPDELAREQDRLELAAREAGCTRDNPFMFLGILGITAIPDYGMSEHGLIDARTHQVVHPVLTTDVGTEAVADPAGGAAS